MNRTRFAALAAAFALMSCSDGSGPGSQQALLVLSGLNMVDTAGARPTTQLTVRLRGPDGTSAVNEEIVFTAVPGDQAFTGFVGFAAPGSQSFTNTLTLTTNSSGQVTAQLGFGFAAGIGRVAITSPTYGLSDTITFTINAASASRIAVTPRDTAVYVGNSIVFSAQVTDQFGNPRNNPVIFEALDNHVTPGATGTVIGATHGRALVRVSSAAVTMADTVRISVVPVGVFAAVSSDDGAIVIMGIDGSGRTSVATQGGVNLLQWMPPAANAFLFFRPTFGGHARTMSLAAGPEALVVPTAANFAETNWARASADGSWIYFRGARAHPGTGYIWRIHPDGTGLDSLPVPHSGTTPGPSPDGSRVIYQAADLTLHMYSYGAAKDSALGLLAQTARWAPDGSRFSFRSGSLPIQLIQPNGAGLTTLPGTESFDDRVDWSPDSEWLIARNNVGLSLIKVTTGEILPLAFTASLQYPSWKP